MTTASVSMLDLIRKSRSDEADLDFLREGIRVLAQALMEADVTAQIGAALGEHNPDGRATHRNGYRDRRWDTRAGTVDLAIPKLRQGSYFPDFLLEPRRRAEKALASVVMQAYVEGVSTRRVDDVAKAMGVEGISKSQVSRMCGELDETVQAWRSRPLDAGPYPFLWIDALVLKVREGGRVVNTSMLVATDVNAAAIAVRGYPVALPYTNRMTSPPALSFRMATSPSSSRTASWRQANTDASVFSPQELYTRSSAVGSSCRPMPRGSWLPSASSSDQPPRSVRNSKLLRMTTCSPAPLTRSSPAGSATTSAM